MYKFTAAQGWTREAITFYYLLNSHEIDGTHVDGW